MSSIQTGVNIAKKTKRKAKKRNKAQIEADRRLASLRKNLAREIELDFDRFSGESPSAAAGLFALTRLRIILAFLQAFFPMFISAPAPRRVKRAVRAPKKSRGRTSRVGATGKRSGRKRQRIVKVVRLKSEDPTRPNETEGSRGLAEESSATLDRAGERPDLSGFRVGDHPEVFVSSDGLSGTNGEVDSSTPSDWLGEGVAKNSVATGEGDDDKPKQHRRGRSKTTATKKIQATAKASA
jgi:hypothetical protein